MWETEKAKEKAKTDEKAKQRGSVWRRITWISLWWIRRWRKHDGDWRNPKQWTSKREICQWIEVRRGKVRRLEAYQRKYEL
jgi:hypothetical protein